ILSYPVKLYNRQSFLDYFLYMIKLAREINFEPNVIARSLREHKSYNIGVIIPSFQIPFYSVAVGGIHSVLTSAGYNVMTSQTNETYESEVMSINSFLKSRVDGIIISFSSKTDQFDHIKKVVEKGLPVVQFNRVTKDVDLPGVSIDDYKSAFNAAGYLIKRGGRRIAYIAGPELPLLSRQRKQGYIDCLKAHGLPFSEELIFESDFSVESGIRAAEKILKLSELPDSIFCVCDSVAIGAMKTLKRKGIKIPDDISVIGFTNDFFSGIVEPALTTISQPVQEIGERAAELLLLQLNRKFTKWDSRNIILKTSLIVRESTR
ncbi:MAG TPA: LacI family DNA-binding transcriptional regulator, partial [Bacteroidales bacterium]|nr:LacI family DNA-binding transcriptional regulator [Bacteroidales bacterium]